ncbi:uncharacterized protein [Atheta coriaria]
MPATYSTNIVDQQGVHYIIQSTDSNQTFLLDNVIEQPVLQQFPQQQLYLVSSPPKQVPAMQPVVLNHTLQQPVILNSTIPPVRGITRANMIPRPRSAIAVTPQQRMLRGLRPSPRATGQVRGVIRPATNTASGVNGTEMVKMEDGRILPLEDYQKLMEQKKLTPQRPGGMVRPARPTLPRPAARPPIHRVPEPIPTRKPSARIIGSNQSAVMPKILRDFQVSQDIKDIISKSGRDDEFENSIRMFVLLAGGEQRLITFTTPKEDCTIDEILDQVGVAVDAGTRIGINEINRDGINIVVSVGYDDEDDDPSAPPKPRNRAKKAQPVEPPPKIPTPPLEPPEEPPKLIPGKMAVCTNCGFLSEDFNRCQRCRRKLPDNSKAVLIKPGAERNTSKKPGIEINLKPRPASLGNSSSGNGSVTTTTANMIANKGIASPKRKLQRTRLQEVENMVVTLSSDEEDDDSSNDKPDAAVADKEPSIECLKNAVVSSLKNSASLACCSIACRTIRIGSYRFTPVSDVALNCKEMIIKVPHTQRKGEIITILIARRIVYKVLANFQKTLPVVFIYVLPSEAEKIASALGMTPDGEFFYNPISDNELHRRIVLLPSSFGEEDKWVFETVYGEPKILEEINAVEANSILLKTCAADVSQAILANSNQQQSSEVRQLLIYPPGKGGISINTEDYMCLERDQFLNDAIIDFYLKHMIHQMPEEQRAKVQVFSTFFYTRLTTKPARNLRRAHSTELDANLTPAQKRHARVQKWTKNIDLFEKDFIVVPINENAHWFLAIICFPGMDEAETFSGIKIKRELCKRQTTKRSSNIPPHKPPVQIKAIKTPIPEIEDNSDKDEAEGDDSEFEVDDSDEATPTTPVSMDSVPIKQPCILIFDSLAGAGRSRVVATLRDYLTCEYAAKKKQVKVFTKEIICGACPKIPQQNNYTDCGLYLLQYVEHFFKKPITDYRIPIQGLKDWFDEIIVTRKREDIANLIKELMLKYKKDINILPAIALPTQNGDIVPDEDEDAEDAKQLEKDEDMECGQEALQNEDGQLSNSGSESSMSPGDKSSSRQSAMSYLKAKRIVKVKADTSGEAKEEPKKRKVQE